MSKYRRGDAAPAEVPPDSPEGRDLGLNDHLLPGGQPHISNRPVRQQEAPGAAPRPEYRGGMAHGVPVPADLNLPQERQPMSEMHYERATAGLATFAQIAPDAAEQLTPIAVRIVQQGGTRSKLSASFLRYVVPLLGANPVRLCGRDPRRSRIWLFNETAGAVCRISTFPGDLIADPSTNLPLGGALLPVGTSGYIPIVSQSELFAICTGNAGTVSVIQEYEQPLEP